MLSVLQQIENARCCYLNKVSQMQQASWKGEEQSCFFQESIFLYNNLIAAERSLLLSQNAESEFDLTDFTLPSPPVLAIELTSESTQLIYVNPISYASKTILLQAIADAINGQGVFDAEVSGSKILISTTDVAQIGATLTLNIISPYEIKNETTAAGKVFSMQMSTGFFGLQSTYNPLDNLCWVFGVAAGPVATISFCDIDTLTEVDIIGYTPRSFIPNGLPSATFNPYNKIMYAGGYNGVVPEYTVSLLDADPNSLTYKVLLAEITPIGINGKLRASMYNPVNNQMYLKMTDEITNIGHIAILDDAHNVIADISVTNDAAHSFVGELHPYYMDYDRSTGNVFITCKEFVLVVDGNPLSLSYNTIVFEYPSPQTALYGGSIRWNSGTFLVNFYATNTDPSYIYRMDSSGNFTQVLSEVGIININIANGYVVCNFRDTTNLSNSTLNKVVLYSLSDYSVISTIQTISATYETSSAAQTDQTRLTYVPGGLNYLTVFESVINTFTYDLTFAPPAADTNPCFSTTQQNAIINHLLDKCGCSGASEVGSFGDSVSILAANEPNSYIIDSSGNPIIA